MNSNVSKESLLGENIVLKLELKYARMVLRSCKKKLDIYRAHSDGIYQGGVDHTALISWIDKAVQKEL